VSEEKKKGGLIRVVLLALLLGVAGAVGYLAWDFKQAEGVWPWHSKDHWNRFAGRAADQAKDTAKHVGDQAKVHSGKAWKYTTAKTATLYDKSKTLLATMGKEDEEAAKDAAAAGTPLPARPTPPADPLEAKSQSYKYGKDALAEGIKNWRVSLDQPGAAELAKKRFELAIRNFEQARGELGGDKKVDEYLDESRAYLADTEERIQMIKAAEAKGTH